MKRDNMFVAVATVVMVLVMSVIYIEIAVYENNPEYRDEYHEGVIIAKNETRLILYVEEELTLDSYRCWIIVMDHDEFILFDIGDQYSWILKIKIPSGGLVNMTVSHGW